MAQLVECLRGKHKVPQDSQKQTNKAVALNCNPNNTKETAQLLKLAKNLNDLPKETSEFQ
jgi:hypothetical protein